MATSRENIVINSEEDRRRQEKIRWKTKIAQLQGAINILFDPMLESNQRICNHWLNEKKPRMPKFPVLVPEKHQFYSLVRSMANWCVEFSSKSKAPQNEVAFKEAALLKAVLAKVRAAMMESEGVLENSRGDLKEKEQDKLAEAKKLAAEVLIKVLATEYGPDEGELKECADKYLLARQHAVYWLAMTKDMSEDLKNGTASQYAVILAGQLQVPKDLSCFDYEDTKYDQTIDVLCDSPVSESSGQPSEESKRLTLSTDELLQVWTRTNLSKFFTEWMCDYIKQARATGSLDFGDVEKKKSEIVLLWGNLDECCQKASATRSTVTLDVYLDPFKAGVQSDLAQLEAKNVPAPAPAPAPAPVLHAEGHTHQTRSRLKTAVIIAVGALIVAGIVAALIFGGPLAAVPALVGAKLLLSLGLSAHIAGSFGAGVGLAVLFSSAVVVGSALTGFAKLMVGKFRRKVSDSIPALSQVDVSSSHDPVKQDICSESTAMVSKKLNISLDGNPKNGNLIQVNPNGNPENGDLIKESQQEEAPKNKEPDYGHVTFGYI